MTSALFSPIRLADLELPNRIVVAPMCQYSAADGVATDWHVTHLGMLANSGAGLVVVEATHVERRGRITHGCLGLYSDDCEAALARVSARDARLAAIENPSSALGRALADGREIDGVLVWELARAGDPTAIAVLERLGEWLGIGIITIVNALNPDVVVVGGGVAQAGELILAPARQVLARRGLPAPVRQVELRPARFGRDAGVIGAALLARESIARRVVA